MKILILLSLISFSVHAQDARSWNASIGFGVAFKKNLRVGNTYEDLDKKTIIKPIPFIQGNYGRVSLQGQGLSLMAYGNQAMNVSAFITRAGDRYHGLDMTPRKDSVFTGISGKFLNYGLSVSHDINGRSKGYITHFNYGKMFIFSSEFMMRAGGGIEWFDDRYAEYYYSVKSTEVKASRREHHVNNYFQPGVNIMPIYKTSENTSIVTILGMKFIPKDVRQSPTMNGDKLEYGGIIAFNYKL